MLVQTDCTTAVPAGLDSGTLFSLGSQSGRAINPVAKKTIAMYIVCGVQSAPDLVSTLSTNNMP